MLLGALGAVSIVPPYLDSAVGLDLDVASRLEVADHLIPGIVVIAACVIAVLLMRGGRSINGAATLAAVGVCLLAGLWETTTHIPLLLDVGKPGTTPGAALLHSLPALAVLALAAGLVGRLLLAPGPD